jgi:hypothetical protein
LLQCRRRRKSGSRTITPKAWHSNTRSCDGGELRTLRDAGVYFLALPPAEAEREHRQIAMEFLISAAEKGGIVMARIAMLRALNHGDPDPAPALRRKRAKAYRVVR